MSSSKQAEGVLSAQRESEEAPPAYQEAGHDVIGEPSAAILPPSSIPGANRIDSSSSAAAAGQHHPGDTNNAQPSATAAPATGTSSSIQPTPSGPTPPSLDLPSLPPAYTPSTSLYNSSPTILPIAIPQITPSPTSRFLPCYPPCLLPFGIPPSSFGPFLDNLSSILGAKSSDRALSHAGDIGRSMASPSKESFRNFVSHTKAVGKDISSSGKKGDILGAAFGVVSGAVTIPMFAVGGLIASVTSLPGTAIAAAVQKPRTPRQRAEAYIGVANEKWFAVRGLRASLVDMSRMRELLGERGAADVDEVAAMARRETGLERAELLRRLEKWMERLDVVDEETADVQLEIGRATLWLVIKRVMDENEAVQRTSTVGAKQ